MSFLLLLITEAFPSTLESNLYTTGRIGIDYFETMEKESKIQKAYTYRCLIIKNFGSYSRFIARFLCIAVSVFFLCEMRELIQQNEICKVFTVSKTE